MFIVKNKLKSWEINISNIQDKQIMEICEPKGSFNFVSAYREILQDILTKWPVLLASQFIDIREFSLKEIYYLLSTAIVNKNISITMTKDFTDSNILKEYYPKFVLHICSNKSIDWIPYVLRFGSISVPHIIYCKKVTDETVCIDTLCQLNQQFIDWFQFSGDMKKIIELGEKVPLIYWVCDSRMYFFTSLKTINDLRILVGRIAEKNNLIPFFHQKNIK